MQTPDRKISQGGYCETMNRMGPFKIGRDFQAPSPIASVFWRVKIEQCTLDDLIDCLKRARAEITATIGDNDSDDEIYRDAVDQLTLSNGVNEALAWYYSDWRFQPDERKVRAQLKELEVSIARLKSSLPSEDGAIGTFLRQTYTGEAFVREDLKPDEQDLAALQITWREQVGPMALSERLDVAQRYVSAARECLGKRKPLEHRKAALVLALARAWKQSAGGWPTSGRDPIEYKQTGPFADFVRIACALLPNECDVGPLDAAIRSTCDKPSKD